MTLSKTDGLDTEINPGIEASVDTAAEPINTAVVSPISLKTLTLPLTWAKTDRRKIERRPLVRRQARPDWYTLAIVLLILASAALCFYRLMWAIQP
jgi:hypothetical protein